ncbi:MAG: hypothetical protein AB8B94_14100 [Hyphomicrobiales bacterium]
MSILIINLHVERRSNKEIGPNAVQKEDEFMRAHGGLDAQVAHFIIEAMFCFTGCLQRLVSRNF